ncbi:hypothetical protein L2744_16020 [Shewanella profunda]|uniref:hypothetical protein n=1 Tax=Shewanella profunda TaxID=254793 RepID=UPI00200FFF30|nr:hypothetical protein [Shewanella profunda]MCL1091081.1 hypothetical protein [Shewanella profunda]
MLSFCNCAVVDKQMLGQEFLALAKAKRRIKVKVVGLHPTPDQKGKSACSPFGLFIKHGPVSPTELKAPWAFSVLMLSRQTLVPDSTDAISASMPRSRNER